MPEPKKDQVPLDPNADETSAADAAEGAAAQSAEEALEAEVAEVMEEAEAAIAEEAELTDAEQVEAAKAEAKEWQDKYLRLHAEWDTYRRRMKEQREEEKVLATEGLVKGLIPVIDDFERTIDYAEKNGEAGLLGGITAIRTKLGEVLAKEGVEIIDPAGQAFDPLAAQAVATVDDPSVPDETVAQVYQKGFRMGPKVLRPAMVTVTTGGPKRETLTEDEEAANEE